jgi:hypothetical protein
MTANRDLRVLYTESIKVGVAYGATHIPAVIDYLGESFRYYVENAEWLTVCNARS